MSSKTEKAENIKELALNGQFSEIEAAYGAKAAQKGRDYASTKLVALRSKISSGEDVKQQKTATAFLLFSANLDGLQEMAQLELLFKEQSEKNADSDDLDSVATQPQDFAVCSISDTDDKQVRTAGDTKEGLKRSLIDESFLPLSSAAPDNEEDENLDRQLNDITQEKLTSLRTKKIGFQCPLPPNSSASMKTPIENDTVRSTSKKKHSFQLSSRTSKLPVTDNKGTNPKASNKSKITKVTKKSIKAKFANAPKKALNAFLYFAESARRDVLADNPSLKITEVAKEVGVRWKLLEEEDKAPYEERVAEEKLRYIEEMKVYHEQYPDEADNYELRNRKGGTKVAHKRRSKNISEDESDDNEKDSDKDSNHDEDDDDFPASNTDGLVLEKLDERDDFEESNLDDRTPGRFSQPVVVTELKKRTSSSHSQSGRNASLKRHLSSPLSAQRRKKMHQTSNITSTYNTPQPKIVLIDSAASAIKTAKIVSALKGIKSDDLPQSEDIKRTRTMAKETCPFPPDFVPEKGSKITLILEPYREFVSELAVNLLTPEDLQLVQATCLLSETIVHASVVETRSLDERDTVGTHIEFREAGQILTAKINGELYTILYLPFSSPLLRTEVFLLDRKTFTASLAASWMIPNAQVRRLFAAGHDGLCEWQEGSIYDVRSDMKIDPYSSVSVVWMELERHPRSWFYSYDQMDNNCSPWDLQLSQYVLPENVHKMPLPPSLLKKNVTADAILLHLKSFDFSSVFMYSLTSTDEYCEMFPHIEDRLDFHVITKRCQDGLYRTGTGFAVLFDDLALMCKNGKQFNSDNSGFQPWILIDMMEKNINQLQSALTDSGITITYASQSAMSSSKPRSASREDLNSQEEDPQDERGTIQEALEQEEFTQEV